MTAATRALAGMATASAGPGPQPVVLYLGCVLGSSDRTQEPRDAFMARFELDNWFTATTQDSTLTIWYSAIHASWQRVNYTTPGDDERFSRYMLQDPSTTLGGYAFELPVGTYWYDHCGGQPISQPANALAGFRLYDGTGRDAAPRSLVHTMPEVTQSVVETYSDSFGTFRTQEDHVARPLTSDIGVEFTVTDRGAGTGVSIDYGASPGQAGFVTTLNYPRFFAVST